MAKMVETESTSRFDSLDRRWPEQSIPSALFARHRFTPCLPPPGSCNLGLVSTALILSLCGSLDLVGSGRETVLLVSTITEGHDVRPAAPAPRIDNFPVDDDKVGTVLR